MPPDSWKARRAHEALLKAQCAVLGAGAGAFPDRAEMLGQLARAAGCAGFGFAVEPVAEGAEVVAAVVVGQVGGRVGAVDRVGDFPDRDRARQPLRQPQSSEEPTSELQSLMRTPSAVFRLKT